MIEVDFQALFKFILYIFGFFMFLCLIAAIFSKDKEKKVEKNDNGMKIAEGLAKFAIYKIFH